MSSETEPGTVHADADVMPSTWDVATALRLLSKKREPIGYHLSLVVAGFIAASMLFLIVESFLLPLPPGVEEDNAPTYVSLGLSFFISPWGRNYLRALGRRAATPALFAQVRIVQFDASGMLLSTFGDRREVAFAELPVRVVTKRLFVLANKTGEPEHVIPQRAFLDEASRSAFAAALAGVPPTVTKRDALRTFGSEEEANEIQFQLTYEEMIASKRIALGRAYPLAQLMALVLPAALMAYAFHEDGVVVAAAMAAFVVGLTLFARFRMKRDGVASKTVHVELGDVLRWRSVAGAQSRAWKDVEGLAETETVIALRMGAGNVLVIPKRVLSAAQVERIRALVPERGATQGAAA